MYGFHFLVFFLCVKGIKDTQVCEACAISFLSIEFDPVLLTIKIPLPQDNQIVEIKEGKVLREGSDCKCC